jgi:hypothetical protein
MKRLKKDQVSVALKEFEAVDFVRLMFCLTRLQCKLEATCRLTQPLPSQMLIPLAPFHRCLGFPKNTSNLPVYDVYPCDSV